MRTGQGTQHKIVKSPKSGVKMTLIKEDKETGYSHVRLESGLEGWVLSRYLIDQPIAKSKLAAANAKVKALRLKVGELNEKLNSTSKSKSGFEKDTNRLTKDNAKLQKELTNIKNAKRINRERVAYLALGNTELIQYLVEIMFASDSKTSIKAAWVLEIVCEKNLSFIAPYLDYFTETLVI